MRPMVITVAALASLAIAPETRAQSATDSALAARIATVDGLLSGIATMTRQTGLSEEQVSVQLRKSVEGFAGATESQRLALAKLPAAREYATSRRTCPEVSAGRAGNRSVDDAGMMGRSLANSDARRAFAGVGPVPEAGDEEGGERATLLAVGMPLPPVTPASASTANQVRRWGELRRAASVMAARYAVAAEREEP